MSISKTIKKFFHDIFFYSDEQIAEHRAKIDRRIAEIEAEEKDMLSKYCPKVGGDCRKTCVNFRGGEVYADRDNPGIWITTDHPRCALWND